MAFTKKTWVNVPDPSNLPSAPEGQDALARFDADNMNRIEDGIEEALNRTKEDIGLGNVPNVTTNDQTPTYKEATDLETLESEEKLSIAFGKIKKAITNLISHLANKSNPHDITKEQLGLSNITTSDGFAGGDGAISEGGGGAVGYNAKVSNGVFPEPAGGFAGGYGAITNGGAAIGYRATTASNDEVIWNGAAIGSEAKSENGGAVGAKTSAINGGAIGYWATTKSGGSVGMDTQSTAGGAVGNGAIAGDGFSGGYEAWVTKDSNDEYIDAIQLGTGTNENPKTLQIYDYQLMDANGVVPTERLPQSSQGFKLIKTQNISWNFTSTGQMKKQEQITGIDFTSYDQYKIIFKGTMNYTQTASGTSNLYLGYTPTEAPAGNTTGAISSVEFKSPVNVPISVNFKGEEITITKKRGTSYSYSSTGTLTDNSTTLSSSIAWTTDKLWFWLYTAAQANISVSGTVSVYGKVN